MRNMYNKLPRYVNIKNERFIINADFRIFIDFEEEMQGNETKEAIKKALSRFYPAFLEITSKGYLEEAINQFILFYRCGCEEEQKQKKGKGKNNDRIYSYTHDHLLIWGTYKQYFNVDLSKDELHWWKFKAYWKTIPESSEFSKIRGYRAYTGKDKELLDLKEYYKLPPTKAEIENKIRQDKLFEALK